MADALETMRAQIDAEARELDARRQRLDTVAGLVDAIDAWGYSATVDTIDSRRIGLTVEIDKPRDAEAGPIDVSNLMLGGDVEPSAPGSEEPMADETEAAIEELLPRSAEPAAEDDGRDLQPVAGEPGWIDPAAPDPNLYGGDPEAVGSSDFAKALGEALGLPDEVVRGETPEKSPETGDSAVAGEDAQDSHTADEAAGELGVASKPELAAARAWAKDPNALPKTASGMTWWPTDDAKLLELWNSGKSPKTMAEKLRCSLDDVKERRKALVPSMKPGDVADAHYSMQRELGQ